jgi:hypothetical protein
VLLPLAVQLSRDPEAEIRATVVKQLAGLGECFWLAPQLQQLPRAWVGKLPLLRLAKLDPTP